MDVKRGKKVVVTGGAGFIGSNLVKNLSKNYYVVIVDDLSSGHVSNIQSLIDSNKIDFIEGSITDLSLLQKTFENAYYVFHLAAIASVPKSINDPALTHAVNVDGLSNVLIASKDNNVKKVVYSSSCAVYGNPKSYPISESTKTNPLSPYAESKLIGEQYCNKYLETYNLPTVSLRYFNVYGPFQDPNSDYAAVIPKFIDLVLNDNDLVIYGNGEQTRDFIFVEDVVKANILMATNKATGIYNLGSGKEKTINDLAKIIMKLSGKNININYKEPRSGDILQSYADIIKISKLGYKLEFKLEQGLKKTIDWFLSKNY